MALMKASERPNTSEVVDLIAPPKQEDIPMGFNPANMGMIVNLLTDLYPEPIISSVREVVSNAIDATRRVSLQAQKPIEILTPTSLNPVFTVTDHGVGMSADDVRHIYSQYGVSTKAGDFSQTGAYGLGAKSPLAYCTEFHVSTTKDGVTTNFTVSRKVEGNVTSIRDERFTGKPSGTTVSIPSNASLSDLRDFEKALNVYKKFAVDVPIIIDGRMTKTPENFELFGEIMLDEDTNTTGRVWVDRKAFDSNAKNLLNYGSFDSLVAYTLSGWTYKPENTWKEASIVVELKPGVVDFSSSRDSITKNERFRAIEDRVKENFMVLTDDLLGKVMEIYRKMDFTSALRFLHSVNFNVVDNNTVVIQSNGAAFYNRKSFKFTLKMDDFTLDNGLNPLRMMVKKSRENAYALVRFTGDKGSNYSVVNVGDKSLMDSDSNLVYNHSLNSNGHSRYTQITESMIERVVNKSLDSVVSLMCSNSENHSANPTPTVVITGVDADIAAFIGRNRLLLSRTTFEDSNALLVKKELDTKEKAVMNAIYPAGFVTMTAAELEEKTIAARKANRKVHVATKAVEQTVTPMVVTDGFTAHSEYETVSLDYGDTTTVSDLINKDAVILCAPNYRNWKKVYFGAVNNGADLTNKKIVVISNGDLRAVQLNMLAKHEHFYVGNGFSHSAKIASTVIADRTRNGDFLVESTANLSNGDAIALWVRENTNSAREEVWGELAKFADDGTELGRIINLLATPATSTKKKLEEYYGMSRVLLETKLGEETAEKISFATSAIVSMTYSSWNSSYREELFRLALNKGGGGNSIPAVHDAIMGEVFAQLVLDFSKKVEYAESVKSTAQAAA